MNVLPGLGVFSGLWTLAAVGHFRIVRFYSILTTYHIEPIEQISSWNQLFCVLFLPAVVSGSASYDIWRGPRRFLASRGVKSVIEVAEARCESRLARETRFCCERRPYYAFEVVFFVIYTDLTQCCAISRMYVDYIFMFIFVMHLFSSSTRVQCCVQ
jgi:hypothetical protein